MVRGGSTAPTPRSRLGCCFQQLGRQLLRRHNPLRVAKPGRSPELEPRGSSSGAAVHDVRVRWETRHELSSPALAKGRKSCPNRFSWAAVWIPEIFPCCGLTPLLARGDQRETIRAELLEPPVAGPALGSGSNAKASCSGRVNCPAWRGKPVLQVTDLRGKAKRRILATWCP